MSAEKIIYALLAADSAVSAVVSSRIYPGELPQGAALPALVVSHLTTVPQPTMDAASAFTLVQSRVEVTLLVKADYVTLKSLLKKVRQACEYKRGTIASTVAVSVVRDLVGPDARDSDLDVLSQTIDFMVTWQDPA